eukprot:1155460-Pelagomonas_calceolata.AAC.1
MGNTHCTFAHPLPFPTPPLPPSSPLFLFIPLDQNLCVLHCAPSAGEVGRTRSSVQLRHTPLSTQLRVRSLAACEKYPPSAAAQAFSPAFANPAFQACVTITSASAPHVPMSHETPKAESTHLRGYLLAQTTPAK